MNPGRRRRQLYGALLSLGLLCGCATNSYQPDTGASTPSPAPSDTALTQAQLLSAEQNMAAQIDKAPKGAQILLGDSSHEDGDLRRIVFSDPVMAALARHGVKEFYVEYKQSMQSDADKLAQDPSYRPTFLRDLAISMPLAYSVAVQNDWYESLADGIVVAAKYGIHITLMEYDDEPDAPQRGACSRVDAYAADSPADAQTPSSASASTPASAANKGASADNSPAAGLPEDKDMLAIDAQVCDAYTQAEGQRELAQTPAPEDYAAALADNAWRANAYITAENSVLATLSPDMRARWIAYDAARDNFYLYSKEPGTREDDSAAGRTAIVRQLEKSGIVAGFYGLGHYDPTNPNSLYAGAAEDAQQAGTSPPDLIVVTAAAATVASAVADPKAQIRVKYESSEIAYVPATSAKYMAIYMRPAWPGKRGLAVTPDSRDRLRHLHAASPLQPSQL